MNRNSVDLFGEIATKENIVEAIKKYGHVTISEQERRRGGSICRSCFNLLKGISDRVKKFASLCQKGESSPTAVVTSSNKRTYLQQKSPSSKVCTPSKLMNRPKRIRPSTSPSRQTQSDDTAAHRLAPRGCLLTKFASATEKPESQPLSQPIGRFSSAQVNETRGHEILQFAGLRSQVCTVYVQTI